MRFAGRLPIAGQPATTTATNTFSGSAPVGSGNTDVAVTAADASGNTRTNTYRVSESGATASYTYDPNGNLATKAEGSDNWTYTWNAENQLTKVEKNGAEVARFSYDPRGRRVEKVAAVTSASHTYDGSSIVREVQGVSISRYIQGPGIDEPLAADDGAALVHLHADGLGSVAKTTNATGAVTSVRQYDAWGNLEVGGDRAGYAFTGREWDAEVSLQYSRARYYDPKVGRFISEDPLGVAGGINKYAYALHSPAVGTDPLGLRSCAGPFEFAFVGLDALKHRTPEFNDDPRYWNLLQHSCACPPGLVPTRFTVEKAPGGRALDWSLTKPQIRFVARPAPNVAVAGVSVQTRVAYLYRYEVRDWREVEQVCWDCEPEADPGSCPLE